MKLNALQKWVRPFPHSIRINTAAGAPVATVHSADPRDGEMLRAAPEMAAMLADLLCKATSHEHAVWLPTAERQAIMDLLARVGDAA